MSASSQDMESVNMSMTYRVKELFIQTEVYECEHVLGMSMITKYEVVLKIHSHQSRLKKNLLSFFFRDMSTH